MEHPLLDERLSKYIVVAPSACWIWGGATIKSGNYRYGESYDGKRPVLAHRYVYERVRGDRIPKGKTLDHLCRERLCVNPDHLEPVTLQENLRRGEGIAVKHSRKVECLRGHRLPTPTLFHRNGKRAGRRVCRECQNQTRRARRRI